MGWEGGGSDWMNGGGLIGGRRREFDWLHAQWNRERGTLCLFLRKEEDLPTLHGGMDWERREIGWMG